MIFFSTLSLIIFRMFVKIFFAAASQSIFFGNANPLRGVRNNNIGTNVINFLATVTP